MINRVWPAISAVAGQLLDDDALAEPDLWRDLDLVLSGLLYVGDYLTDFRAEAVVFVTHCQFVVNQTGWIPTSADVYSLTD